MDLVIYTPAIPEEHKELVFYISNGYKVIKRSDVLQIISESSFNICIAGTHGKTTITTMVAHLLRDSGFGCNAFLGGIAVNYGTNFWSSEKNVCVIEADEYASGIGLAINTEPCKPKLHFVFSMAAISVAVSNRKGDLKTLLRE